MANTVTKSFSITENNNKFLEQYDNKSEIINKLLDDYSNFILEKEMIEGFLSRDEEDLQLAMSDFGDYLRLIEQRENA